MGGPAEKPPGAVDDAVLLALARQLRTAARAARRDDVARMVEDVISVIATENDAAGGDRNRRADAIVRFLDGLGI